MGIQTLTNCKHRIDGGVLYPCSQLLETLRERSQAEGGGSIPFCQLSLLPSAFLDKISTIIYQIVVDKQRANTCTFISPNCDSILAVKSSELQGDIHNLISIIHPEDQKSFQDSLNFAIHSLQNWHWSGRLILPNGKFKWFSTLGEGTEFIIRIPIRQQVHQVV